MIRREFGEYAAIMTGATGSGVVELQNDLITLGYKIAADGIYGPQTGAAVKQYQTDHRFPATGTVDQQTATAIQGAAAAARTKPFLQWSGAVETPSTVITDESLDVTAPDWVKEWVAQYQPTTDTAPDWVKEWVKGYQPSSLSSIFGNLDWRLIGIGVIGVMALMYMMSPQGKKR